MELFWFVASQGAYASGGLVSIATVLLSLGEFFLGVFSLLVFLIWVWTSYSNLHFFGLQPGRSAGFAFASFLFPVLNIWFSLRIVTDLHEGSARLSADYRTGKGFVLLWWIAIWLAIFLTFAHFLGALFYALMDEDGPFVAMLAASFLSSGLQILSWILTIRLVRMISRAQEEAVTSE